MTRSVTAVRPLGDSWAAGPGPSVLGEGPVWSVRDQSLYWVDIEGLLVHRWAWGTEVVESWPVPSLIGALAIRERGGLIVALRSGIHTFDPATGALEFLVDPEGHNAGTRYNDGTVDAAGRFWIGGMVMEGVPRSAGLYRIEADANSTTLPTVTTVLTGLGCANGAGYAPDGKTMYHTDSDTRTITAFDFDITSGDLSNPRDFAVEDDCNPDGLTVDTEGFVWSAKWDGARVVRHAPDGSIDRVLPMPVPRPTSVAFGGPDLRTLFVTSARTGLSAEQLAAAPLSGHLLVVGDVGVAGTAESTTAL
ncbi:sugar lactone lactonase YvrE [Nakamurella sp. UYEF19]|uniref:SMP-30/gluconolactonase/LRE family protein n=1 Tax=Nakamurella sp. UYEF19 TaxID=1756392 RepID=UPI003398560F